MSSDPSSGLIRLGGIGPTKPGGLQKAEILGLIKEEMDRQYLDLDFTEVIFSNTAAEFDLYNFVLPAGLLGNDNTAILDLELYVLNNTAGVQTITFRVRYGSAVAASVADSMAQSTAWRYGTARLLLQGDGAPNDQRVRFGTNLESTDSIVADFAVDSNQPQTLRVTGQFGVADANLKALIGFKRLYVLHTI